MRMGRSSIEEAFANQAVKAECKDVIRNLNYIRYSGTLDEGCVLFDTRLAAVAENLRKSSGEEVDITILGNQFNVDISTSDFNVLPFSSVVDEVPMRSELMPLVLGEDAQGNLSFLDLQRAGHVLICGDRGCGKTNLLKTFVTSVREGSIEMGNVRFLLADLDGKVEDIKGQASELQTDLDGTRQNISVLAWVFGTVCGVSVVIGIVGIILACRKSKNK